MSKPQLIIKVDVDTDRGTALGVPALTTLFKRYNIPATFLFSLGPDNTGRAIKRIFRPGFFKKVFRSNVISNYGWRTLINGLFRPGPMIAQRNSKVMQQTERDGFEVGIHCYDHVYWQDYLDKMTFEQVSAEFEKAEEEFYGVFNHPAHTAGAAGWQANAYSLAVYDSAQLAYASDCRGYEPFFPMADDIQFNTLQIPTTLPTLDELLALKTPQSIWINHYLSLLSDNATQVLTIHAELEGMQYLKWFEDFLKVLKNLDIVFIAMADFARSCHARRETIPICKVIAAPIPGRSGLVATQL